MPYIYYATEYSDGTGEEAQRVDYPPFDFISQADIEVWVGGELQTVGFDEDYILVQRDDETHGFQIMFVTGSTPPVGIGNVKLRRKTTRGALDIDFQDSSTLTEADIEKATKQGIYLAEEALDAATDALQAAHTSTEVYISGDLPGVLSDSQNNHFLQVAATDDVWEVTTPISAKASMPFGTAADKNWGVNTGEVPLNPGTEGTEGRELHSGAYTDIGTVAWTTIPMNTQNAALGSGAYYDVHTTGGTLNKLILMDDEGIPEIYAKRLLDVVASIPIFYARYSVPADTGDDTASTPLGDVRDLGHVKAVWNTYPLSSSSPNPAAANLSTPLTLADNVIKIPPGVWKISWSCMLHRTREIVTRFYNETTEEVLVEGLHQHHYDYTHASPLVGTGRFTVAAEIADSCVLQYWCRDIMSNTVFGRAFTGNPGIEKVFANVEITMEEHA